MPANRLPRSRGLSLVHHYHTLSSQLSPQSTNPIFLAKRPRENQSNLANAPATHAGEGQYQQPRDAAPTPFPGLVQLGFSSPAAPPYGSSFSFTHPFGQHPPALPSTSPATAELSNSTEAAPLRLVTGAFGIPKRLPRSHTHPVAGPSSRNDSSDWAAHQVGEDAYFINEHAVGVADGVGGFARAVSTEKLDNTRSDPKGKRLAKENDIDPDQSGSALFARRLMHFCASEAASASIDSPPWTDMPASIRSPKTGPSNQIPRTPDPPLLKLLRNAYSATLAAPTRGAATVMFGVLANARLSASSQNEGMNHPPGDDKSLQSTIDSCPSAILHLAHVGDCLGLLIRSDSVIWRSEEMWLAFNTPYQLSSARVAYDMTGENVSLPSQTQTYTIPVHADDVLVIASDGLADNLPDATLLSVISRVMSNAPTASGPVARKALPGLVARALCDAAYDASMRRPSEDDSLGSQEEIPFAKRAREWGSEWPKGRGKRDDITVVVSIIEPSA